MTTTRSTGFIRSGEVTNTDLLRRSRSLGEAIESGGGRLPADQVERAREVQRKVATRTADIGSRTVVALAGATGSGKSSLFNALVGEPVSRIGARRPTTSVPSAAMWGDEPSDELLDRLQVAGRHQVPLDARRGRDLGGLLLLDLPDFDSRVAQHRAEADRVIEHADVLVWVTDPQKYADAVLHEEYIRTLAGHRAVSLVVLNQIDRLSRDQVTECVDDLRRLLDKDGLRDVEILAVSAARGIGVEDVAAALAGVVHERTAAQRRLLADLTGEVVRLREHVADGEVTVDRSAADELTEALCAAAGVPAVVDAVATDFRRHSARRGGWPFSRWLQRRGSAPTQRVGLDALGGSMSRSDARRAMGRSSLPPASPAARAAVDVATRRLGREAAAGLPTPWADAVYDAATPPDDHMHDALDEAVLGAPLRDDQPGWWSVVGALQWVFAAVAVAGLVWLLVGGALELTRGQASLPTLLSVPIALLLLVIGVVAGIALALVSRWLAERGARARADAVERRLRKAVAAVASAEIIGPVETVLRDHGATRRHLDDAAR